MAKKKNKTPRELKNDRSSLGKRLKRRGILDSIKGIETSELESLWRKYKDRPTIKRVTPVTKLSNYDTVINILDNFVREYEEHFIGWYKDAWRYLPGIKYFWQRLDREKLNADENFIPKEIEMHVFPPSDWIIDDVFHMLPEDMEEYLYKLYDEYMR